MKIIVTLIIVVCLLNVTYAARRRRSYSEDLFKKRLLELLLEANERGLLDESGFESKRHFNDDLDEDLERESRKIFGFGDDIFINPHHGPHGHNQPN